MCRVGRILLTSALLLAVPGIALAQKAAPVLEDDASLGSKPPRIRSKQEIADAIRKGVVLMLAGSKDKPFTAVGYGFPITSEFVLTASHLFPEDTLCKVRALGTSEENVCHVRRRDEAHDLALIGIERYSSDVHPTPIPLDHAAPVAGSVIKPVYLLRIDSPLPAEASLRFPATPGDPVHIELNDLSMNVALDSPVIDAHGKVVGIVNGTGASLCALPVEALADFTTPLQQRAKEYFQFGLDELKGYHYENARSDFTTAALADPSFLVAQYYVGFTASELVFPHLNIKEENVEMGHTAIDAFRAVIDDHPDNISIIRKTAEVYFNIDDFDHAREWQHKLLEAAPKDFRAYIDLGMLDWYEANENAKTALSKASLEEDYEGNATMPPQVCRALREANQHLVDDGIASIKQALALHPGDTGAAGYMNALLRRKADLECFNPSMRHIYIVAANKWLARASGFRPEKPTIGVVGGIAVNP